MHRQGADMLARIATNAFTTMMFASMLALEPHAQGCESSHEHETPESSV
jgi:hypothetical protein